MSLPLRRRLVPLLLGVAVAGCADQPCQDCDRLVIAAVGEPSHLFPPLVYETVGRDIGDQVYERLADLSIGGSTIDPAAYRPGLASRWERLDSLTWRFHLRDGARWHDSIPVTGEDVRFSFTTFADPEVDAAARAAVEGLTVTVVDSATVDIGFPSPGTEQLYDATYHVRIIPRHVWVGIPVEEWGTADVGRLVGSGPYRVAAWQRPSSVRLEAAATYPSAPSIRQVTWTFHADPDAAANLLLSHEAHVIENVPPARRPEVEADSAYRLVTYPSAVYGFLGFHMTDAKGSRPHPVLGDKAVRRALTMAVDRAQLAQAVVGSDTEVPRGPMSRLLWIDSEGITTLPVDTAAAGALLDQAGWTREPNGMRRRRTSALRFDILVPSTSRIRQVLAEALQQSWRRLGVETTVTAVDFSLFNQRLAEGRFDSYIGAWVDEPSPRSLADQWTRDGWEALNYGRYANPVFDSLLGRAAQSVDPEESRRLWTAALDTLNADAPALFLFNPVNHAALSRRLTEVTIDPFSWIATLPQWTLGASD